MKPRLTLLSFGFLAAMSLSSIAQTKLPYVVDPITKKRITYVSGQDAQGKTTFSNGKIGYPIVTDIDYSKVYSRAKAPVVVVAPPVVTQPVIVAPPVTTPDVTIVGTGSGNLDLSGIKNKNLKIKAGTYTNIGLNDLVNVKIDASGVSLNNNSNFDISKPTDLELYGFTVSNHTYRAINVRGLVQKLYIHDATFVNIANSVIAFEYAGDYDGTSATTNLDITLDHLSFTSCSSIVGAGGGLNNATGKVTGLSRNLTFTNNNIKDCQGSVIWSGAADHYVISGNNIDHVNYGFTAKDPGGLNGPHNGLFGMTGNGDLFNNKVINHQGNLIRAWGVSYGSKVDSIRIYNNVVYNSSKYSAFELQVPPYLSDFSAAHPGVIKWTNARVSNNTAGHLNTVKDWEGQMLDLYFTGGTLDYSRNLGFEMNRMADNINSPLELGRSMINMGPTELKDGNLYFNTSKEAVSDLTTFKSLHPGVGAKL